MCRSVPCRWTIPYGRATEGPGRFFAEHPALFAVAVGGATLAAVSMAGRAAAERSGPRRLGWALAAVWQVVQIGGMYRARQAALDARREMRQGAEG